MGAVRIMVEPDLERDQTVLAEIEGLLRLAFFKIPQMDTATVFQVADLLEIESRHEGVWRRPFRGRHHIVAWLIPEIISKRDVAHRIFPASHNLEIAVQMEIAARRFASGVAKH